MAAPKIKADYAQLTEIAQCFQQQAEALDQQLNTIKHGVENYRRAIGKVGGRILFMPR